MMDENTEVEIVQEKERDYFWTEDENELRRTFIFEMMNSPDVAGNILVENMEMVYQWIKEGKMPEKASQKPKLKAVGP